MIINVDQTKIIQIWEDKYGLNIKLEDSANGDFKTLDHAFIVIKENKLLIER